MAGENKYTFLFSKMHDVMSYNKNCNKEAEWRLQLFKLNSKDMVFFFFFSKKCKMLKTSGWDYEKSSVVTYPVYSLTYSPCIKQAVCKELRRFLCGKYYPQMPLIKSF